MRTIADEILAGGAVQTENKPFHIICILDKSGSMRARLDQVIGGYNSFIAEQREGEGDAYLTLVTFSDDREVVYERSPIQYVDLLSTLTYSPDGSTALLDTVYRTLDTIVEGDETMVLIITDGQENASTEHTKEEVQEAVGQHTAAGVEFVYIGANVSDFDGEASNLGILSAQSTYTMPDGAQRTFSSSTGYVGSSALSCAFASLTDRVSTARSSTSRTVVPKEKP